MTEYSMLERLCGTLCRAIGRVPISELENLEIYAYLRNVGIPEPSEEHMKRLKELHGVEI